MIKKFLLLAFLVNVAASAEAVAQTSFAPLAERLMPSVVNISTKQQDTEDTPEVLDDLLFASADGRVALGSGFAISDDGYIATNYHVIEGAQKISVVTFDNKVYEARVIGTDIKTDIALIKIASQEPLLPIEFGDSDKVKIGDWVLAIGNPFGLGSSVTAGIISAKSRDIDSGPYDDYLQTDASINQGNSGGPMFDMEGKLIGINTAIFSTIGNSVGVGFALPSNQAKWVLEELKTKGKVERGWLGISVKSAKADSGVSGLAVLAFADDETAKISKLKVGDIIVELEGQPVGSAKAFSLQISQKHQGDVVNLKIWRGGNMESVKADVMLMPDEKKTDIMTISPEDSSENNLHLGKNYPALGFNMQDLKVTYVMPESEAFKKGVRDGDVLKKVNGRIVYIADELEYQIDDSKLSGEPLRLEFESGENQENYFVEIVPQR